MDATTLRGLFAQRDLHLRLAIDESDLEPGALDAPVRWVHGTDLADPTPFLTDQLVLLTTGTQLGEDAGEVGDYVRRLQQAGVCGLGFGTDVVRAGIPSLLIDACRAARMPLFEVPYRTPFIAVARVHTEAMAAQAFARRSWALAAQRAIALAALRPDGLGATLAELAKQLDAWVGLFDAAGVLTREHPAGVLDAATTAALTDDVARVLRRGARAGSSFAVGETPFTLQTLGHAGHLRGVIAIATSDLDQEGRGLVTSVIAMAGLALEQGSGIARARTLLRSGVLQSLVSGDPALARRIARDMWGGLPEAPVVVAATDAADDAVTEWLELRTDYERGTLFFGRDDDGLVLASTQAAASLFDDLARRFAVRIGVSTPVPYAAFSRGLDEARTALQRGSEPVTRFVDLNRARVLSALDTTAGRALAAELLAPLAQHPTLTATLRAWLAHDARHDVTADALGVHRHTVRARIAQAEQLLGLDLSTFPARAELWAALQTLSPPAPR
ncbi:PucR family transcriptional regulator [Microbacterium protaetiae]|uniref:PucR family transcriptional regulator n=1 Tax=Microbacterium protaetiae TaxID=2509458 RepID=A0A4P6EEC8_9MICO|nr:PucR family transcriptional regulator [Microbacterium protaetiae]QAY60514.1 PucR family transcriptional regulator [Microbacterium protaetiae]